MENLTIADLLLLPMLSVFFGLLIFLLGTKKERDGGVAHWKWAGLVVVLIGAFYSWKYFSLMAGIGDPVNVAMYRANYEGKRYAIANYASFLLPMIAALACVAVHFLFRKRANRVPNP